MRDVYPHFRRMIIPYDTFLHAHMKSNIEYGNVAALAKSVSGRALNSQLLGVTPTDQPAKKLRCSTPKGLSLPLHEKARSWFSLSRLLMHAKIIGCPFFLIHQCQHSMVAHLEPAMVVDFPLESLAKIIYQVTIEGRTPGDISFPSVTDSSRLLYNQKHFHEQGVQLDDRTRRLIETQDVLTLWDENV